MSDLMEAAWRVGMEEANKINEIEDAVAMEMYGCKFDDLDYADRELVTYEAYDRLNK